jgi:pimeloyl-ACP methyl ester carboxylesterase
LLIGQSLGGTLAAIFSVWAPVSVRGLVLLGAPLCFQAEKPVPRRACHLGAVRPAGGGHLRAALQRRKLCPPRAVASSANGRALRRDEALTRPQGTTQRPFRAPRMIRMRTSRIVDPPNGRIPSLTPEAQKTAAAERDFRLALIQATETCRINYPTCNGGKYDPRPSPRRAKPPPRYNNVPSSGPSWRFIRAVAERGLTGGLPGRRLFGTEVRWDRGRVRQPHPLCLT